MKETLRFSASSTKLPRNNVIKSRGLCNTRLGITCQGDLLHPSKLSGNWKWTSTKEGTGCIQIKILMRSYGFQVNSD